MVGPGRPSPPEQTMRDLLQLHFVIFPYSLQLESGAWGVVRMFLGWLRSLLPVGRGHYSLLCWPQGESNNVLK